MSNIVSYQMALRSVFREMNYDPLRFPYNTIFGSSLPPVVCRRAHVLFTLFVFVCVSWCPITLCCHFCLVYHRPESCIPNVVSFSGLSILDCTFGFL